MRLLFARLHTYLLLGLLLGGLHLPSYGQATGVPQDSIPAISAAETLFEEGVRAYEDGMYELARRRFVSVVEQYRFNQRTTSALLMAGHTLFQLEQYEEAQNYYTRLIEQYPSSRYVSEAEEARETAEQQLAQVEDRPAVINLGIALPLEEGDRTYTQDLFNGIRVAVEEHNARTEDPKLRMVFRNSGRQPDTARQAVEALIREDSVDVIVGPLYSKSEVIPAAGVAEDLKVPLVAPMATEEGVTMNRDFVFQINPPLAVRARLLAEYAVLERSYNRVGIITQLGTDGERMAKSFQSELERRNGEIGLFELLTNGSDWYRLPEHIEPVDTLQTLDALFLPITGDRALSYADAALGSLSRVRQEGVPLLGNSVWRSMGSRGGIRQFNIIFEDSFWADNSSTSSTFERQYDRLAGEDPNQLAYVGYDVVRFLTDYVSEKASGRALAEALREANEFEGQGIRINFDGRQINHGLFFLSYRNGQRVLIK